MLENLKEILREFLKGSLPEVGPDTRLTSDLGLNSIELFDLVCVIEERFGVTVPDRLLPKLVTVRDVTEYLEAAGVGPEAL